MSPANKHLNEEKSNKRKKLLILLLLLLLLISITITTCTLLKGQDQDTPVLAPDYAPAQEDDNAVDIEDDEDEEKLDQEEGGGAVSLIYSPEALLDLSDKTVYFNFNNPQRSNQNMLVQLEIQGVVFAQSGLIKPGKKINKLVLLDNVLEENTLPVGGYKGQFVVYFYDDASGEKAMLNSELKVDVKVQE